MTILEDYQYIKEKDKILSDSLYGITVKFLSKYLSIYSL